MRDEIEKEVDQSAGSTPAWWVSLLPATACIGIGLVVSLLSLLF